MKNHTHLFNYHLPLYDKGKNLEVMQSGSMTRRGTLGDGKADIKQEDKEVWEATEERVFGDDPAKLNWARNGGKW